MSQWASLADPYSDSGTAMAPLESPPKSTVSHRGEVFNKVFSTSFALRHLFKLKYIFIMNTNPM